MAAQLEHILRQLVRTYTTNLSMPSDDINVRTEKLTLRLAKEGILVIAGQFPLNVATNHEQLIGRWVSLYADFYHLLTTRLFSLKEATKAAYYTAGDTLIVATIEGELVPVTKLLAYLVVPYVAARKQDGMATQVELQGMMKAIIDSLEGDDLDQQTYHQINVEGVDLLGQLLNLSVNQISLAPLDHPLFNRIQDVVGAAPVPSRPNSIPEQNTLDSRSKEQSMHATILELPSRNVSTRPGDQKTPPPIPGLLDRLQGKASDQ